MNIAAPRSGLDPLPVPEDPTTSAVEPVRWPITIETFGEMVRKGVISEKEPIFLWKGSLVQRMSPNPPHLVAVLLCADALRRLLGDSSHHVRQEQPLAFRHQQSLPEPDIAVLRGQPRDYTSGHPTIADASMVIEVTDSSLALDRSFAGELALEGVPDYWIINLPERCVEVYTDPAAGTYRQKRTFSADQSVPLLVDDREAGSIRVAEILP